MKRSSTYSGLLLLLPIAAASAPGAQAQVPTYQVRDLGSLGGRATQAADLNESGQVTGYSELADGQIRAFLYFDGDMQDLGSLGGGSLARALNEAGGVTGFSVTAEVLARAFRYANGVMSDAGSLGASSNGNDINANGDIAGDAVGPDGVTRAVVFTAAGVQELGAPGTRSSAAAINDSGEIAGTYEDASGMHAFRYGPNGLTDLFPGRTSFVVGIQAINGAGQIAGGVGVDGTTRGFLSQPGATVDVGTLGGDYCIGLALNSAGKATGISATASGERHAFLFSSAGMVDLGTLGGSVSIGYAINDLDQVVGESTLPNGSSRAVMFANGTPVDLGPAIEALAPGNVLDSAALDINGRGEIIGRFTVTDSQDAQHPTWTRAFIATPIALLFERLLVAASDVGPGKSLENRIRQANEAFAAQDLERTCKATDAFLKDVDKHAGKQIAPEVAADLTARANDIRVALACS
jgi:probable HAF family extracellular repeat protein